jgi:IclR family transcriptional regulator, KDG regulon repressor
MVTKIETDFQNSTLDRALNILEYVASCKGGTTLVDVVKVLDIPKNSVIRIVESLKSKNYIQMDPGTEKLTIGIMAIHIGVSGLTNKEIVDVATHYLRDLAEQSGETSFLGVCNEGQIVYLYKASGTQSIRTSSELGSRRPMHCTALGKAILSNFPIEKVDLILESGMPPFTQNTITDRQRFHEELGKVRSQGYACDDEEIEVGLTCLAVPVFNYTGQVIGAISLAGPTARITGNKESFILHLKEAGKQISARLGFVPSMSKYF